MITEDYVSFETAKLLKEKGFDEECRAYYVKSKVCGIELFHAKESYNYNNNVHPCTSAPTIQMAMSWLRELKRCIIVIIPKWFTPYGCAKYAYSIWADDNLEIDGETNKDTEYDTYEETCEEAIKYCLENLI